MLDIELHNNNAFKWYSKNNSIFVIGNLILDNKIYEGENFAKYIESLDDNELEKILKESDGSYTIVINKDKKIILASDVIRSFPVFYKIKNGYIVISDDINYFKDKQIDDINSKMFIITGYVSGNKTLYKDIFQLEGGKILTIIDEKNIEQKEHFSYDYNIDKNINDEQCIKKLDELYDNTTKNLINYLNGRRAVIPLSGGHDSRLIAFYLKKNGYKNILAYTYGRKDNPEAIVSKKVAEYLGIEWHFVEYKNKNMRKKYYSKENYSKMADYCSRGFSVPHIQEWEAIDNLLKNNVINKEDVVIPGFSGDFIAGSHLDINKIQKKDYTIMDLKEYILKKHYHLYNWRKKDKNKELENIIWNRIKTELKIKKQDNDRISVEELNNLFEKFDFAERQTKFISNSVRIYDFQGIKWYMPLWDKKLMKFWNTIDLDRKIDRKLYYIFADKIYGDLTSFASTAKIKEIKKSENKFIQKIQAIIKLFTYYFKHFLNYYGYLKFSNYIKYCFQYGSGSYYFMFSCDYLKYIKKDRRETK